MVGSTNCSMTDCIKNNTSNVDQMDKLVQFGFNDMFNVVAYSGMGVGKYHKKCTKKNTIQIQISLIFIASTTDQPKILGYKGLSIIYMTGW
jgi:hypothetical protein